MIRQDQRRLPGGAAGRELRRALLDGEQVEAWASGKAGALLVATDRRALVIKTGMATGTWFGRKVASFGYRQLTSVDLHAGAMDGYVELAAGGVQGRPVGRVRQLLRSDNVCPFNKWGESDFRRVVAAIQAHLYAP